MLKPKIKSTTTNGTGRMPRASDFKLAKKLDAKTKRFVEAGRAVMDALQKERENGQKVEK